jgi:hypothetical protein
MTMRPIERLGVLWLHLKLAIQLRRAAAAIRAWNRERTDHMMTIADILKKIEDDLAWRGPNGGVLGHIVFNREQVEYLHRWALLLIHERDELVAEKVRAEDKP